MSRKQGIMREFYRLFYNEGQREEAARLLCTDYLNHQGGEIPHGRFLGGGNAVRRGW